MNCARLAFRFSLLATLAAAAPVAGQEDEYSEWDLYEHYLEDFQDDAAPTQGGFASTIFMHRIGANEFPESTMRNGPRSPYSNFFNLPGYTPRERPWALVLDDATDYVTFDLPPGKVVVRVQLLCAGPGIVHVIGTKSEISADMDTDPSELWEVFDTEHDMWSEDLGDIVEVRLTGPAEGVFADMLVWVDSKVTPPSFLELLSNGGGCGSGAAFSSFLCLITLGGRRRLARRGQHDAC